MVSVQKWQSLVMIVIIAVICGGDDRTKERGPVELNDDSDNDFILEKS